MQYDFDEPVRRDHTDALSYDGFRSVLFADNPGIRFSCPDEDLIRMWVADMEFSCAPEILQAVHERVDRKILGYTTLTDLSFCECFQKWCERRYGMTFHREELWITHGIIPALYDLVDILTQPDEQILFAVPSYGAFAYAAEFTGRKYITTSLIRTGDSWAIDFEDLEKKAGDPKTRVLIWCNPHNPTGRIWTEEELGRLMQIVREHELWIISDEIHCDLTRCGRKHVPLALAAPDYRKLITCMAPSKTFNLAGMQFSTLLIRDRSVKAAMRKADKSGGMQNPLSLAAAQAAYEKGDAWLDSLREYLDENLKCLQELLQRELPAARFLMPEATYLAWVDVSNCLKDAGDLPLFFAKRAGVLLEGGDRLFVGNAEGYIRLNAAMPRRTFLKGVERIIRAVREWQCCRNRHTVSGKTERSN